MAFFDLSEYEPVENRIRAFWEAHPNGRILPDKPTLVLREDGKYQWECWTHIYIDKEDAMPTTRGFASEIEGSSPVNRTNASENCETSSIGRALANLGFATKGKRPSREEMEKVARAQQSSPNPSSPPKQPMTDGDWNNLLAELNQCGSEEQLKVWSALASTYSMPEDKRLILLQIYQEQKQSLTPAPEAAPKKKAAKAEQVV
jgi:hypothetical protein